MQNLLTRLGKAQTAAGNADADLQFLEAEAWLAAAKDTDSCLSNGGERSALWTG